MLFAPVTLATSVVMTSNLTTASQPLPQVYGYAVQAVFTGTTVAGTLKLQCSVNNASWADVDNSSQTLSASGTFVYNVNGSFYPYMRVVYTDSGSSGDARISVYLYTKGV